MFTKFFIATLAIAGVSSGAAIEARHGLSSVDLQSAVIEAGLAYHGVGESIRLTGPNGQGGDAVISAYRVIINEGNPEIPPPGHQKAFSKPIQFALCDAETTAVLQILETLTLFKLNVRAFTPSQVSKIHKLLKMDMAEDKIFAPTFEKYVPVCAGTTAANGNATQASYMAAIKIYSDQNR